MLRLVILILILFINCTIFAFEQDVTKLKNKAIEQYGEKLVKEIESWGSTLQDGIPTIKPLQLQPGSNNSLNDLIDRFIDFNKERIPPLSLKPEVLIFVSTSIDQTSLRLWARQAEKVQAPLILRGLIDNSFKQTIQVTQEIFGKQEVGGFSIDPEKFTSFKIQKVPAVVVNFTPIGNGKSDTVAKFDVVYGNIGLNNALEIIVKNGSSEGRRSAAFFLSQLQGKEKDLNSIWETL